MVSCGRCWGEGNYDAFGRKFGKKPKIHEKRKFENYELEVAIRVYRKNRNEEKRNYES